MSKLPSYQKIIAMGDPAIPLILEELEWDPDNWFIALQSLTGDNPVQEEQRGKVNEMAQAWVAWGKQMGYIS